MPRKIENVRRDDMRFLLARSTRTLPSTLVTLARDKSPRVRIAVASNPKTPLEGVQILLIDKNADVMSAAFKNKKVRNIL